MKKSRFSEHQIITILKSVEAGRTAKDVCREHGISSATFYACADRDSSDRFSCDAINGRQVHWDESTILTAAALATSELKTTTPHRTNENKTFFDIMNLLMGNCPLINVL